VYVDKIGLSCFVFEAKTRLIFETFYFPRFSIIIVLSSYLKESRATSVSVGFNRFWMGVFRREVAPL